MTPAAGAHVPVQWLASSGTLALPGTALQQPADSPQEFVLHLYVTTVIRSTLYYYFSGLIKHSYLNRLMYFKAVFSPFHTAGHFTEIKLAAQGYNIRSPGSVKFQAVLSHAFLGTR